MPSATVPRCCPAKSPSRRSATIRSCPVANTSWGIFWLVANDCPDSVTLPRARAILNSSSPFGFASMMNPRSAPVASMAESITSTSTSSSTRDEPRLAEPIEQRRQRAKVDDPGRVAGMRVGRVVREENQLGTAAAAQADPVAMAQRPLGDLLVVDERAASRPAILQHEPPVVEPHDFGVLARHVGADRARDRSRSCGRCGTPACR